MSLAFMLDTDTVSFALRGLGDVATRLLSHRPSEICLSSITLAELRYGADLRRSAKLHRLIDEFSAGVNVVPFEATAATQFGVMASKLAGKGVPIGNFDTLIAAHALALKLTLVTNNAKHFSRVPKLKIENWL